MYQSQPKEDDVEFEDMTVVCVEMQFSTKILAIVQTSADQAELDSQRASETLHDHLASH